MEFTEQWYQRVYETEIWKFGRNWKIGSDRETSSDEENVNSLMIDCTFYTAITGPFLASKNKSKYEESEGGNLLYWKIAISKESGCQFFIEAASFFDRVWHHSIGIFMDKIHVIFSFS